MRFDAIVLAGGRSSRLGGMPKARLEVGGRTLLMHAVTAALAAGARRVVVVGGPDSGADPADFAHQPSVGFTREDPPFGGPAAAVAEGLRVLDDNDNNDSGSDGVVLVLACDVPRVGLAVDALVAQAVTPAERGSASALCRRPAGAGLDGVVAVDGDGRAQPLLALYNRDAVRDAVLRLQAAGGVSGASMRALLGGLRIAEVAVPAGAAADVDTWADAERWGAARPGAL